MGYQLRPEPGFWSQASCHEVGLSPAQAACWVWACGCSNPGCCVDRSCRVSLELKDTGGAGRGGATSRPSSVAPPPRHAPDGRTWQTQGGLHRFKKRHSLFAGIGQSEFFCLFVWKPHFSLSRKFLKGKKGCVTCGIKSSCHNTCGLRTNGRERERL